MRGDLVSVIEAAYDAESGEAAWLRNLVERSGPFLERGFGVTAARYRLRKGRVELSHVIGTPAAPPALVAAFAGAFPAEPQMVERFYPAAPTCSTASVISELPQDEFKAWSAMPSVAEDAFDAIGVLSGGADGCVLAAPKREIGPVPRSFANTWTRIATHLAAALRLRSRRVTSDAVLSPSGRVDHAEGPARDVHARQALTAAAKSMDRARGGLRRRAPDEAVEIWRALVAGRWSLVDHFDNDGKRFIVACRNPVPAPGPLGALTAAERRAVACAAMGHTNKLIAYELGLTPSAVAMQLARAAKKLGVRSRVELIAKYRQGDLAGPARNRAGRPT